jgi:hypothetical protein
MIIRPETDFIVDGQPSAAWQRFLFAVNNICFAQQESGTTAQRPTKGLYVGRRYFDTTLVLPIYYTGSGWIDAAGNGV